jgi:hypothetical protein
MKKERLRTRTKVLLLASILTLLFIFTGCNRHVLIVSSPELKKAAKKQHKDINALIGEWEKTKNLIEALDRQQEHEMELIGREVALMVSKAKAAEKMLEKVSDDPASLNPDEIIDELHGTDLEIMFDYYKSAKKRVNTLQDKRTRKMLLESSWEDATGEEKIPDDINDLLFSSEEGHYTFDLRFEGRKINKIQEKMDKGNTLSEEEKNIKKWIIKLADTQLDNPSRDKPQFILVTDALELHSKLHDIRNANWKEIDKRLTMTNQLITHHYIYMDNDIETVQWEDLAGSIGRVVQSIEDTQSE